MPKIARATMKMFGSSAGANQIAQFGSLNAGSPTFTTNIATIQALSNYLVGWYNAVIGGNSPAIEDMNALFYLNAYQLCYLFQSGIPEWDSGTTYYTGSIAQDGSGNIFVSLQDNNSNNALTDTTYWRVINYSSLNQYNILVGDSNNTTQLSNTNLLGDYLSSYKSGTFTVTIASPAVFTYTNHGLQTCDRVYLATTGSLPTGLTPNIAYFLIRIDANTFNLANSYANALAGIKINTTGTQSGTHTCISGGINEIQGTRSNPFTAAGDLEYSNDTFGNPKVLPLGTKGKYVRAGSSAPDYGWDNVNSVSSASYTITDTDGYDTILMSTGGSNRTLTLPSATNNAGRSWKVIKTDSGTGQVQIVGTINGSTASTTANAINYQYGSCIIYCDGTSFYYLEPITESGAYTPILTNVANTSSRTAQVTQFTRRGNIVSVYGAFSVTFSGGSANMTATLPVPPAAFTQSYQAGGAAMTEVSSSNTGWSIYSTTGAATATFFSGGASGDGAFAFSFNYRIA